MNKLIILLLILSTACLPVSPTPATSTPPTLIPPTNTSIPSTPSAPDWGHQTKFSGCVPSGVSPDPACTPGAIFPVDAATVCVPGYSSRVRNVTTQTKAAVYAEYGIASHVTGQYEVDHYIPLELGGSNDISNLWPEASQPVPGFHEKDLVENYLHAQICSGAMSIYDAQVAISVNWLNVYNSMPK